MMTSADIRRKFIDFWTESPRNHNQIPNASLVPVGDSTILFVNSGMFPLVPYLAGESHPSGKRLVNFQRSLRTDNESIEEVGDNRHTLMFEMMGNWSLGDYFKREQLPWVMELYHEKFGLDINNLYVTVFAGSDGVPRDDESIAIWQEIFAKYGIDALVSDNPQDVQKNFDGQGRLLDSKTSYRIFTYSKKNWWERGYAVGELGGPDSEVFYDLGPAAEAYADPELHVNSDNGRFVEIGNSVFMQYQLDKDMKWQPLAQKNVDFGGGFERVVMCVQGKSDIFETDLFEPIIKVVENLSSLTYKTAGTDNQNTAAFRVIADHGRVSTFILADGIRPSSKDQGYILRRFIRRMVRFGLKLGLEVNFTSEIALAVIARMQDAYPHLQEHKDEIIAAMDKEETAFRQTLVKGLKELSRILDKGEIIDGNSAFYIYETYGFPLEMTLEELKLNEADKTRVTEEYNQARESHRLQSQKGAEQKFKGGLADHSAEVVKLHTAHHLLLAALQKIVSPEIKQRGSNITAERLRLDFNFERKLTEDELKQVEELVNKQISAGLPVVRKEMSKAEAEKLGAQMEFGQKYGDVVSVYFMGNDPDYFSIEFCGGPHVSNTAELGKFKILKEEASGAGIRRIKATLV